MLMCNFMKKVFDVSGLPSYLITFLISEDKTTLMMGGAVHDENATFALLMYAYEKALSFPFLPLSLLPFPGILQISN